MFESDKNEKEEASMWCDYMFWRNERHETTNEQKLKKKNEKIETKNDVIREFCIV